MYQVYGDMIIIVKQTSSYQNNITQCNQEFVSIIYSISTPTVHHKLIINLTYFLFLTLEE